MIIASCFRDSASYIDLYAEQIKELRQHVNVSVIAVEGDSHDDTYERLCGYDFHVLRAEHGGPKFPSIDHPLRWRQLAAAGNIALCAAVRLCAPEETFIYVESDLLWDFNVMLGLQADLEQVPAVAPMSMRGGHFYDVWGHRKDGAMFTPHHPFHPGISHTELTPIDSAGSCFALHASVLPHVAFSQIDCIRGIGRSLTEHGKQLYLDPTLAVYHP